MMLRKRVEKLIRKLYSEGRKDFVITGNGEISNIVEFVIKTLDIKDITYSTAKKPGRYNDKTTVLVTDIKNQNNVFSGNGKTGNSRIINVARYITDYPDTDR